MTFINENTQGTLPTQETTAAPNARETAWLAERIKRGKREMFTEIAAITPGIAAALLGVNDHNRRLSPRRSDNYAEIIRTGRWKVTHQGLAVDRDGRLLDGQHRCAGIIKAGVSVKMMISFGWDAENFALIDTGANRSSDDLVHIDGLDYATVRAAVARAVIVSEAKNKVITPDRALVLQKCREMDDDDMAYACRLGSLIGGNHKIMQTSAAAWAIWKICKQTKYRDRLDAFLDGVKLGADLPAHSPILRLRENAKKLPHSGGQSRATRQAAAMILAWNAWVEKRRSYSFNWGATLTLPDAV